MANGPLPPAPFAKHNNKTSSNIYELQIICILSEQQSGTRHKSETKQQQIHVQLTACQIFMRGLIYKRTFAIRVVVFSSIEAFVKKKLDVEAPDLR